jgi:hypothetical protein
MTYSTRKKPSLAVPGLCAFLWSFGCSPASVAPSAPERDWAPYVAASEGYFVYGPRKHSSSELKVPTPVGELKIPVTYFKVGNNIFYISSHARAPRLGGTDAQILESQAQGILAKFEKFEVQKEPFFVAGLQGLRLRLRRPDSYKIIELYVTPSKLYQVVTDLPSAEASRVESFLFRYTFTILK